MPETSAIRKTSLTQMIVAPAEGTQLQDAIKDALVTTIQTGIPVVLVHNSKRYEIHLPSLLRLIVDQSALVTGKHQITRPG